MNKLSTKSSLSSPKAIAWTLKVVRQLVQHRMRDFFDRDYPGFLYEAASLMALRQSRLFRKVFSAFEPTDEELLIFIIALTPHLDSTLYNLQIEQFLPDGGELPEFGGVKGNNFRGVLPTGETTIFLLNASTPDKRLAIQKILSPENRLAKFQLLQIEEVNEGEPLMSGRLLLDPEVIEQFTFGEVLPPKFSTAFGAEVISTELDWQDLILGQQGHKEINDIQIWLDYNQKLFDDWGMSRALKPGYRALFYGPPGTGKTLTATLLGKRIGREVYRVDISKIVSKYVGETEKNLATIFDKAINKNWILFFDEADSIFGKRTQVKESQDKYANQEVAYLLQRVEQFPGLVILATNFKSNIDEAFFRRFQSIIHFPLPNYEERLSLWQNAFPKQAILAPEVNLEELALNHEISGSIIINIVQFTCLRTISRQEDIIRLEDIEEGLQKEYLKLGRIYS